MRKFKPIPDDIGEFLAYDPSTGKLHWKKLSGPHARRVKVGTEAGSLGRSGYIRVCFRGEHYVAHRIAWKIFRGEMPTDVDLDHRDLNKSNNRIENLREATVFQNRANTPALVRNKSGLKGVSWKAEKRKWFSQITLNGKWRWLGYHATPEEAHATYVAALIEARGEFARAA